MRVCVLGDVKHCEEAAALGIQALFGCLVHLELHKLNSLFSILSLFLVVLVYSSTN